MVGVTLKLRMMHRANGGIFFITGLLVFPRRLVLQNFHYFLVRVGLASFRGFEPG